MDEIPPYKQWFKYAQDDLLWSKASLKEGSARGACFAAQQVAEKSLKAYLINKDSEIKKIHDLRSLLELCIKFDQSFENLRMQCETLTNYYAPTRYPDIGEFMEFNEESAKQAYVFAENILNFVEKKLSAK